MGSEYEIEIDYNLVMQERPAKWGKSQNQGLNEWENIINSNIFM